MRAPDRPAFQPVVHCEQVAAAFNHAVRPLLLSELNNGWLLGPCLHKPMLLFLNYKKLASFELRLKFSQDVEINLGEAVANQFDPCCVPEHVASSSRNPQSLD
jgi:hypothetical protein